MWHRQSTRSEYYLGPWSHTQPQKSMKLRMWQRQPSVPSVSSQRNQLAHIWWNLRFFRDDQTSYRSFISTEYYSKDWLLIWSRLFFNSYLPFTWRPSILLSCLFGEKISHFLCILLQGTEGKGEQHRIRTYSTYLSYCTLLYLKKLLYNKSITDVRVLIIYILAISQCYICWPVTCTRSVACGHPGYIYMY
mgnify:CR=1 FL=1